MNFRAHIILLLAAVCAAGGLGVQPVRAHTGEVVLQQATEPYRVTVFATPTPLAAGPAEFHVLVQETATGEPVLDTEVGVTLTRLDEAPPAEGETHTAACCMMPKTDAAQPIAATATRDDLRNLLFYTAMPTLPASGTWQLRVEVGKAGEAVAFETPLQVRSPLAAWENYWAWWAFPPAMVGVFALHQSFAGRKQAASSS